MTEGRPLTVVAIIAAHNEADVIEHVVRDLIEQGVSVYFIDDDSTDGTREIVERYVGRGVLAVERFDGQPGVFEWARILERKAELASTLDADWFIHHDADEFRESPWLGLTLRDAIQHVDALGYNAIDWVRYDFWPTHDAFEAGSDVREAFADFAPPAPYDRLQVRCWKRSSSPADLAGSGGHDVRFPDRSVCPVKFVLRHYPVRGREHARRKLEDRRSRFLPEERNKGWHVQYDDATEATLFRNPSTLTRYDPIAVRIALTVNREGLAELEHAVLRLSRELDDGRRALADLTASRDALRVHAEELRAAVDAATSRLTAIERSWSWRWTAPGREVLRVLQRRL